MLSIVYSHYDFLDILKIQTDYNPFHEKILFINSNTYDDVYLKYDHVIHYNDTYPYAHRIMECLNKLDSNDEYALFIHDIDIILEYNQNYIFNIPNIMQENNIHRVDLQRYIHPKKDTLPLISLKDKNIYQNINDVEQEKLHDIFMVHDAYGDYPYTVNPSIWNLNSFKSLMTQFKSLGYREIELNNNLQYIVRNEYKAQKLYCVDDIDRKCGMYHCTPAFRFFHITHNGKLLRPLNDSSYDEYLYIIKKYNLINSERAIHKGWF